MRRDGPTQRGRRRHQRRRHNRRTRWGRQSVQRRRRLRRRYDKASPKVQCASSYSRELAKEGRGESSRLQPRHCYQDRRRHRRPLHRGTTSTRIGRRWRRQMQTGQRKGRGECVLPLRPEAVLRCRCRHRQSACRGRQRPCQRGQHAVWHRTTAQVCCRPHRCYICSRWAAAHSSSSPADMWRSCSQETTTPSFCAWSHTAWRL